MPTKSLCQVVAYIPPDLRKLLDKEVTRTRPRTSTSSYIESVLRQHLEKKSNN